MKAIDKFHDNRRSSSTLKWC